MRTAVFVNLSALILLASLSEASPSCRRAVDGLFTDAQSVRNFKLVKVKESYPEVLKANQLTFLSEAVIDGNPANGYRVTILYKGTEINFPVAPNRFFTSKSQQSIEGAIRAIEMTLNPDLIPNVATSQTRFRSRDLLKKLPMAVQSWLSRETDNLSREVDVKLTRGFSPTRNFQEPAFRPEAKSVFEMDGYWIPADKLTMVVGAGTQSNLSARFVKQINGKTHHLLLVHPESREFYSDVIQSQGGHELFLATPTASSRSMVVWKEGEEATPFIGKVSLDRQIGNIVRVLDNSEITKSMAVDLIIEKTRDQFSPHIHFIREVAGFMLKGHSTGGWIVREFSSEMLKDEKVHTPLFALYGVSRPGEIPLLVQLIQTSQLSARNYIHQKIIRPLAQAWVEKALKHFLVVEPHAQNALMSVVNGNRLTDDLIYRDNGGFSFDVKARKRAGLFVPNIADIETIFNSKEHKKKYSDSLGKYLEGGFLSQIEKNAQNWIQQGIIAGPALPAGWVKTLLLSEVELAIFAMTGKKVSLKTDYSNLNEVMDSFVNP